MKAACAVFFSVLDIKTVIYEIILLLYSQYMKFGLILASIILFYSYAQPILSRKSGQGYQRDQIKQNRGRKVQHYHQKKLNYHRQTSQSQDNQYWEKDPLCHQFIDGKCVQCSYRAYFKNGQCVIVNPLCKNFDRHDGCCTSCYSGYKLLNGGCVIDYKFKRHHSDDHHRSTQRFKKDDRPIYQATIESITVKPSNIVDPPVYTVITSPQIKNPISVDPPVYTVITPPQIKNPISVDPPVYTVITPPQIKNPIVIDPPVYTVIPPPKENLIRKKFQCSTSEQQVRNRKSKQKARH